MSDADTLATPLHRNAVIVRAGVRSTHAGWTQGGEPEFDLIVANYEPLPVTLTSSARETILIPGTKVAGWSRLFAERPDLLDSYDQIALIDDDIVCTAADLNACFAAGHEHRLSLWQPALTLDSYFSYGLFVVNRMYRLRFTNFVEMMCPFFSTDYLRECLFLFDLGLETGIDRIWCQVGSSTPRSFAVIDAAPVRHTRPVGLKKSDQGFTGADAEYDAVVDRMRQRLGTSLARPRAHAGITAAEVYVDGRWSMAARSLSPMLGWGSAVNPKFAKHLAVNLKQTFDIRPDPRPPDREQIVRSLRQSAELSTPGAQP